MAENNIKIFDVGTAMPGSKSYKVAAGRNAAISVGDLVLKGGLGNTEGNFATAWTAGGGSSSVKPSIGTDFLIGLAASASTETTSAAGTVQVFPNLAGMTYTCAPDVAATWNTQALYDALVGARVRLAYSATTNIFTVLATDSSSGGVIVEPLDITLHPSLVRFSLNQRLNYSNAL